MLARNPISHVVCSPAFNGASGANAPSMPPGASHSTVSELSAATIDVSATVGSEQYSHSRGESDELSDDRFPATVIRAGEAVLSDETDLEQSGQKHVSRDGNPAVGASALRVGGQRYGDGQAYISSAEIIDAAGLSTTRLTSLSTYTLRCQIRARDAVCDLCFGFLLRDGRGMELFGWDMLTGGLEPLAPLKAGEQTTCDIGFRANIPGGVYFVTVALARWDTLKHDMWFDALEIHVEPTPTIFTASLVNLEIVTCGHLPHR